MELITYSLSAHPLIEDLDTGVVILFHDVSDGGEGEEMLEGLVEVSRRYTMEDEPLIVYTVDRADNPGVASNFDVDVFPTIMIIESGEAHEFCYGYEECLDYLEEEIL